MRQRWFGATGRRVPQIAVDGELDLDGALVLDSVDEAAIRAAFDEGRPVVVRAETPEAVFEALQRPEVAAAIVPRGRRDLLELDLIRMTYG